MAKSTRICSQVNQDRLFSIRLLPCARMISATSKGGRVISCGTYVPFHLVQVRQFRVVERGAGCPEMALGEMQVNGGGLEVGVPEQCLHGGQIGSPLQKMCGETVTQGLLILLMNCTQLRFAISVIPFYGVEVEVIHCCPKQS